MQFTYKAYSNLASLLQNCGYSIADYKNWRDIANPVILRHDIDTSISKALQLAQLENSLGIASTYFVLLTTDFYNVFSKESSKELKEIMELGHTIGLHFDEMRYPELNEDVSKITNKIIEEAGILGTCLGTSINTVSYHRPSKPILDANIHIDGIINSYSKEFFKDFKYLSDSRRRWREPIIEIVKSKQYNKLHILTHAFWYNTYERNITETVNAFIDSAPLERYEQLQNNITNLDEITQQPAV